MMVSTLDIDIMITCWKGEGHLMATHSSKGRNWSCNRRVAPNPYCAWLACILYWCVKDGLYSYVKFTTMNWCVQFNSVPSHPTGRCFPWLQSGEGAHHGGLFHLSMRQYWWSWKIEHETCTTPLHTQKTGFAGCRYSLLGPSSCFFASETVACLWGCLSCLFLPSMDFFFLLIWHDVLLLP